MVVLVVYLLVLNFGAVFGYVWVTEWAPIEKIAANSAYNMFKYKYVIVNLDFSPYRKILYNAHTLTVLYIICVCYSKP